MEKTAPRKERRGREIEGDKKAATS